MDRRAAISARVFRMTQAPIEGLILRMAAPTMVTMMITAAYNIADTYFVGSLGTTATAGVGVCFPLMAVIMAIGFLCGHGAGNYISRELGAQNFDNAAKMAATGFVSALMGGGALAAVGTVFLEDFSRLLGATETILPYAEEYLFFILLAAPFMAASFTLNNLLRFQGNAVYGMIGIASGAVLNIALDPLLIFVLDMGVMGASLATMISQCAGFCVLLAGNMRQGGIRIRLRNFTPEFGIYREMARGGFPSLCRQGLASVAVICLNQAAGVYGDAAIAAMSIVQRVGMFVGALLVGFGHGFQPVCGFNYGARRFGRLKRAFRYCVRVSTLVLSATAAVLFVYAPGVIALFRPDDPEVIAIGGPALRYQCLTIPFMGWILITNMTMQNIGCAARASLMALARQGLFMIPFLLLAVPHIGLPGIQIAQPIADAATLLLSIPIGIGVLRSIPDEDESAAASQPEIRTLQPGESGRFDLDQSW